ncbi:MAG: hypothetical protein NVV74_10630 [Magnetospirillum sp.]|nr:hypothetical protein [Magnetospirillum sp.]
MHFTRAQLIGMPLMALIPLFAVLGRFDAHEKRVGTSRDVILMVEHAPRVRYGHPSQFKVRVRAVDGEAAGNITVKIDSSYFSKFMDVSIFPLPSEIGGDSHVFVLPASDQEQLIVLELEPQGYGRARGTVTASVAGAGSPALVSLSAFLLP